MLPLCALLQALRQEAAVDKNRSVSMGCIWQASDAVTPDTVTAAIKTEAFQPPPSLSCCWCLTLAAHEHGSPTAANV